MYQIQERLPALLNLCMLVAMTKLVLFFLELFDQLVDLCQPNERILHLEHALLEIVRTGK